MQFSLEEDNLITKSLFHLVGRCISVIPTILNEDIESIILVNAYRRLKDEARNCLNDGFGMRYIEVCYIAVRFMNETQPGRKDMRVLEKKLVELRASQVPVVELNKNVKVV